MKELSATLRLQFHRDFTLDDAAELVDYFAALGISHLYASPLLTARPGSMHGYDIVDHREINPELGGEEAFARFSDCLKAHGLKFLLDIVPNHTSWAHPWFVEALADAPESDADAPAKARYAVGAWAKYHLLRGQDGGTTPPNNWTSVFGGPAWHQVDGPDGKPSGWWYLHIFDKSQPDLDWDNEEVRAEFRGHLRFWFERGVDGFRIDVAHGLAKADGYPDCPTIDEDDATSRNPYWDQDGLHDVWREWRAVADEFEPADADALDAKGAVEVLLRELGVPWSVGPAPVAPFHPARSARCSRGTPGDPDKTAPELQATRLAEQAHPKRASPSAVQTVRTPEPLATEPPNRRWAAPLEHAGA